MSFLAITNMMNNIEAIGSAFGSRASGHSGAFGDFMNQAMSTGGADKFLADLEIRGIDPERFLSDLQNEGIDPDKFLADLNRGGQTPAQTPAQYLAANNQSGLNLNEVAEKIKTLGGGNLKEFIARNDTVVSSILAKNNFTLKPQDITETPFSFMKGGSSIGADLAALLDTAQASLPDTFKKQLGQSIMAMSQSGPSINSMKTGADLMGCKNGVEALKGLLGAMKGELPVLKLDKKAIPALGELMAEAGLDNSRINEIVSQLAAGSMNLDQVFNSLSKAGSDLNLTGSLVATEEGLTGLGQFFSSLGVSPDVVDNIVSGFKPGSTITSAALKDLISQADDDLLAAPISEGGLENLAHCLRAMGASDRQMNSLANLLSETQGKMSVNDFVDFFDRMGPAQDASVSSKELDLIKTIMASISREQELAKTPVFNETLTKLQAMGDQEIDDDFKRLSPALQALRGGISGANPDSNFGCQMGDGSGQSGQDQKAREQYRQVIHGGPQPETSYSAQAQAVETVQSYGGQETLARQISQKMLYSHYRGIHRLKMKLNPENMGKLDIELKVKGGELLAHIRAESRETYQALAGEIDDLKNALAEGGVKIANMTLSYDGGQSGAREYADLGLGRRQSRTEKEPEADAAAISQAARAAIHDGLLSRIA